MSRFQRVHQPGSPGQLLIRDGEPVALVQWSHDFAERAETGWFLLGVGADGEPDGQPPERLAVSDDVDRLCTDTRLERAAWLAQAETLELLTATAALDAAERALA